MCGCDYTTTIGGIGPIRAFNLIEQNRTIEATIEKLEENNEDSKKKTKYIVPENFLYREARALFEEPDVIRDKPTLEE